MLITGLLRTHTHSIQNNPISQDLRAKIYTTLYPETLPVPLCTFLGTHRLAWTAREWNLPFGEIGKDGVRQLARALTMNTFVTAIE
eukprot:m.124880 g.124880  ORF g.124880 m.124880 type:complete len:86 (-) comp13787_c0_seq6:51-308(-)